MRTCRFRTAFRAVLTAALLTATFGYSAAAQETAPWTGYTDEHHRNDCRLAHQVLTLGQPAVKREWALRTISRCGPLGAEAVAHQLLAGAQAGDTSAVRMAAGLSSAFVHPEIFAAGARLAADGGLAPLIRINGVVVLAMQVDPVLSVTPGDIVLPPYTDNSVLSVGTYAGPLRVLAGALPEDADERAAQIGIGILNDASSPRELRNAAHHLAVISRVRYQRRTLCAGAGDEACTRILLANPDTVMIPEP